MILGLWRQHWGVLIAPVLGGVLTMSIVWGMALLTKTPWLAPFALLGLVLPLSAYLKWLRRCLYLTPTDVVIVSGVLYNRSISFPIRDIDVFEVRQGMLGKLFDYGDLIIASGLNAQTFEKLHPLHRFSECYHRLRPQVPYWHEAGLRLLPPPGEAFLEPEWRAPWEGQRDKVVEAPYRRLNHEVSESEVEEVSIDWHQVLWLIISCLIISAAIALASLR